MNEHVYEVGVWVADDDEDHTYEVDHRFPALPELETVVALKVNVRCNFLDAEERGGGGGKDRDGAEVS